MVTAAAPSGAETIELTTDEILLLRFTCELVFDEESAFGPLMERTDAEVMGKSARALVEKGLADRRTYRPHRELLRRLLILAQPDCRIILLATVPGRSDRVLDLYGRAGAYVSYARSGSDHRVGPPLELVDVLDEVIAYFTPRRSTGDFIDLRLSPLEYFAFSAAANNDVRLDSARPVKSLGENTLDGVIVMPARRNRFIPGDSVSLLPIPDEEEWRAAIHGLAEKGAIQKLGDRYELRGYLRDLAYGLANRTRHVLTRLDFGAEDWLVRDATLVHVPGSLFWLRPTHDGGLAIREVDAEGLRKAVRWTLDELSRGSPPADE